MPLPTVSFKEFVKNPIVAMLFIALMAIGYLYVDNRTTLTNQIKDLQKEITIVKKDYKELQKEFKEYLKEMKELNK